MSSLYGESCVGQNMLRHASRPVPKYSAASWPDRDSGRSISHHDGAAVLMVARRAVLGPHIGLSLTPPRRPANRVAPPATSPTQSISFARGLTIDTSQQPLVVVVNTRRRPALITAHLFVERFAEPAPSSSHAWLP